MATKGGAGGRRTVQRAKPPPSSERSIYFYRVNAGLLDTGEPVSVEFRPMLEQVGRLACVEGKRYVTIEDGNVLCSWVDSADENRFRFATIRRSGLPLIEQAGDLSGLALRDDQGLYEPIHVRVFDDNIVGVEFNFYGPRPSRLGSYLRRVAGDDLCPTFTLDPLLRQDVLVQLNRLQEIRMLELAIRPSYASVVHEADRDLGNAFRACGRVGTPELVTIKLSPDRYRRSWLDRRVLATVRALAGRGDLRENTTLFKLAGLDAETAHVEAIDVLRDQLVASKRIVRLDSRSRAVDDAAAYAAVEQAYREFRPELEKAAQAQLGLPAPLPQ